jgi:hypothetical protein
MEHLILLHDEAVERAFRGVEVHAFRYQPNWIAVISVFVVGLVGVGAALLLWHLPDPPDKALRGVAALLGPASALLAAWALHWRSLANTSFIAFSQEHLFVGHDKRAWRIDRALLDAQTLGFDRLDRSRVRASLTLKIGGQDIPLLLFHPMAFATDIETLIASLLAHLPERDEEGGERALVEKLTEEADESAATQEPPHEQPA